MTEDEQRALHLKAAEQHIELAKYHIAKAAEPTKPIPIPKFQ